MNWKCKQCGTVHIQNPARCRQCGNELLTPMSDAELERQSEGTTAPDAMDSEEIRTYGSKQPEYESSPDVAPDGSIERGETDDHSQPGFIRRFLQRLRGLL